ncbi:hypothetical protein THERMOT_501 [Bathymodiolus thermophilus thioautotrophic gill symbiont]|uniref:hypothetical protein n=1 Tax=Bathymodiolus thermophilus thioautotrophic gill symbiont TaxID=2360 RepID=UPI0013016A7F|nr:hypothetical protein [Bathymodiolus thermophilus thioautotrophic gill symbiont]CAB5496350.1 hypothetical protein THERMOT_501 [Bathymodiolus thermophilus thioautotrophic gill symbiont]
MNILSPTKSEHLTISEYIKMMSDESFNKKIVRTRYQINQDWSSNETGHFLVEYDHPVLRERII